MVSKGGVEGGGFSTSERQFVFLNGRPVDVPRVTKVVNELFRTASSRNFAAFVLELSVPTNRYDVNVTPDKRQVMCCGAWGAT
jgi:DNA mismatch repair protein PMS2